MKHSPRNLKRLVVLMSAMLMVFAVAMAFGVGALGAGFVLAGAAFAPYVWAKSPGVRSSRNTYRFKHMAPNFWDTGQNLGDCSVSFMSSGAPPSGRTRKNRFARSMAYHGDRICTEFERATSARGSPASNLLPFVTSSSGSAPNMFSSAPSMANTRASPMFASTTPCDRKLIDFGLTHYRARDRDFVASLAAA